MLNDIQRADEAKRILDNPVFQLAFEEIRDSIIAGMTNSALGDYETHNKLVIALQMLNQVEARMRNHILTGEMVEMEMAQSKYQGLKGHA